MEYDAPLVHGPPPVCPSQSGERSEDGAERGRCSMIRIEDRMHADAEKQLHDASQARDHNNKENWYASELARPRRDSSGQRVEPLLAGSVRTRTKIRPSKPKAISDKEHSIDKENSAPTHGKNSALIKDRHLPAKKPLSQVQDTSRGALVDG